MRGRAKKKRLAAFLPESVERSTFVLAASLALIILFWQWRPLPQVAWFIQSPVWQASLWVLMLAGFGIVLLSSFIIDHFDLFGPHETIRERPHVAETSAH